MLTITVHLNHLHLAMLSARGAPFNFVEHEVLLDTNVDCVDCELSAPNSTVIVNKTPHYVIISHGGGGGGLIPTGKTAILVIDFNSLLGI